MDRPNPERLYRMTRRGWRVYEINPSSPNTPLSHLFLHFFFLLHSLLDFPLLIPLLCEDFCVSGVSQQKLTCVSTQRGLGFTPEQRACLLWFDAEPLLPFLGRPVTSSLILRPLVFVIYKCTTSYLATLSLHKFKFQIDCDHRCWLETIRLAVQVECDSEL